MKIQIIVTREDGKVTHLETSQGTLTLLCDTLEVGMPDDIEEEDKIGEAKELDAILVELAEFCHQAPFVAAEPLDPEPFLNVLSGGVSQLDDGSLRSA